MFPRPKNAAERLALRQSHTNDARPILEHENGSALYVYERAGKLYALAFWGTAHKPLWHYRFGTEERRNEKIAEFKASVEAAVASRVERSAAKSAWVNPLKVGDLLYTSWGYDQTNVEFYAVTRVSGRRVWIRQIASDYAETGFMSGKTWPAMPIRFTGDETMHTAQPSGEKGVYVKISNSATAWLETGQEHYSSSYA